MDIVIEIEEAGTGLAAVLFGGQEIALGETVSAPGNAELTNLSEGAHGIDELTLLKLLLENLDQVVIAVFANFLTEALKLGGKLVINKKPIPSDEAAILAELQRLRSEIQMIRENSNKQENGNGGVG